MDRATGPPAETIAVPHQALVHNHPRTPRTTGRPPALSQAEEIRAAPAHLRRNRARAELAESFGAGSVLDLPGRPPVDDPSCRGPRRPRAGRRRPGPAPDPDRGRHSRAVPGPEARAGPALGQAPPDRAGPPGHLHPGRKTRTGARPGPRIDPRHESPSTDRSPRQSPGHAATGRRGPHRTGHDNPRTETTRGRTRGPAETAQQDHQFITGPGRTSNSPTEDLADTPHRLPQTPPHLPTNHHSSHRTRILQE